MFRLVTLLVALGLSCRAWALKTPETSSLFVPYTDSVSRVVSYILKPGMLGYHHQSIYFTARCMTDDGRFLVFSVSPNEFAKPRRVTRCKAIIDFEKDVAYVMADTPNWYTPWLDVERDQMWYVTPQGVHRRDLLVDPNKDILVCPTPPEIKGCGTHITLTPDRSRIFLDSFHRGESYCQGEIDIKTGRWHEWSQVNFCCNHGQYNPTDPTLAMCAFEYAWFLTTSELPPALRANPPMEAPPYVTQIRRARDYINPRLWLFRNTGEKWMVPSRITNGAGHEIFTWDGKGFYWCSGGVPYHDLATERQTLIVPCAAAHATMTEDGRYLTFDNMWGNYYRGGGWGVSFWNRAEHRGIFIYNKNPPMAVDKEHESKLHPDPHPMFVSRDRYIVCTAIRPEASGVVTDNRMCLSITPVAPLIAATQASLTPVKPKYLDIPLPKVCPDERDTPCEIALETRKVAAHIKDLAQPAIRPNGLAYTTYALEAELNGRWQSVPFEALQPPHEYRFGATLRFKMPRGATRLRLVVDAPGRFEIRDVELCDNLFNRRNLHDLYPPKAIPVTPPDARGIPAASCDVAAVRGCPVAFHLDVRNFGWSTWWGKIDLEQFDAAGKRLGRVLSTSLEDLEILSGKRLSVRATGCLAPHAAKVHLYFAGVADNGEAPHIEIQQLNLRAAQTIDHPYAPYPTQLTFAVPPASGKTDFKTFDACVATNRATAVIRAGEGFALDANSTLRVAAHGDVNVWARAYGVALDMRGHDLTLGGQGRFVFGGLNVKRPGNIVLDEGVFLALSGRHTMLAGSAKNRLVCKRAAELQINDLAGNLNWTLDARGLGLIRVFHGGKPGGISTNTAYWSGPVFTGQTRLPILLGENNFTFRGPVAGSGLAVSGSAKKPGYLNLLSGGNTFTEGLVVQQATLVLFADGALPGAGKALVLTNAAVVLKNDSETYHLPALETYGSARVTGGYGTWQDVTVHAGKLVWDSITGAREVNVQKGMLEVKPDTSRKSIAGLLESRRIDYPDNRTRQLFTDLAAHRLDVANVRLSAAAYYDGAHPFWTEPPPDTNTYYRGMFAYAGWIWNNAKTNVTWSFAGAAGTHLYVNINGRDVFRYTDNNSRSYGSVQLKPGPNALDIHGYTFCAKRRRMENFASPRRLNWDTRDFGLGYDPQGRNSTNQIDYLRLIDPGDGSLLTWTLPEKVVEGQTIPPGHTRVIYRSPAFGRLAFAPHTQAKFTNGAFKVPVLVGAPKLICKGTFEVTDEWQAGDAPLVTDGRFVLAAKAKVVLPTNIADGAILVQAAGGIAIPAAVHVTDGWRLELKDAHTLCARKETK